MWRSGIRNFLGQIGEDEAVQHLKKNGYNILKRNYKSRLGEIDIIAEEDGVLCFIEVKTRSSRDFGTPQDSITKTKRHKLSKLALGYLKQKRIMDSKMRFDVVSILITNTKKKEIELIKNAFDMEGAYTY